MKKTDEQLQKDVQATLKWEPMLRSAEIGVVSHEGIITLTGIVDSYAKKKMAAEVVKKVSGVKVLADNIMVELDKSLIKTDQEITAIVLKVLKKCWSVRDHKIKVTVDNGWVSLDGILHWNFQRQAAINAIRFLDYVKGVTNKIKIEAEIEDKLEEDQIKDAIGRNWSIDRDKIRVKAHNKTITLSGFITSLYQKEEIENIAWKTPGVWYVENFIIVEHDFGYA